MRRLHALLCILLATLCLAVQLPVARAGISYTGNLDPADPNTCDSFTNAYVGKTADGTLTVDDGSDIYSYRGYLGYEETATGEVTVDGVGSTWTNSSDLYVGYSGSGTLSIVGGGTVNSTYSGYIGRYSGSTGVATVDGIGSTWTMFRDLDVGHSGSGTLNITNGGNVSARESVVANSEGSTGTINFGADGGTLTTRSLVASPTQLMGTGVINVRGLISDVDLVFDSATSLSQTLIFSSQPDQNVTVNMDMTGGPSSHAYLGNGYLGVGRLGSGSLIIQNGITVNSLKGFLGYNSGSTGVATVDGVGSTWTNGYDLYVGLSGSGTLNIVGGGTVSADRILINSTSLLAIDVGRGSSLDIIGCGGTTIDNDGVVRVIAGAGAISGGVFSPILAGIWSGSGIYQAVGGTWNDSSHQFTVSGVQSGTSGVMETIDLASTQRALIADSGTGWSLGASFLAMDTSTMLNFTATTVTGETLTDLEALIGSSESVLGAWELLVAGDGYTEGDPAYLSFDVGAGFSRSGLQVWHFDGVDWTEFDTMDLTYDGTYASFTVTGFSGYAVSTVPEPGTLALLIAAALGFVVYARRKRKQYRLTGGSLG